MSLAKSQVTKLVVLLGICAVFVNCAGSGADPVSPPPVVRDSGTVNLVIARSTTSTVPLDADSAFVRIWNGRGVDEVQVVEIPIPGATTNVSVTLPVDTGYSVGVLAWHRGNPNLDLLAGGETDSVSVLPNQSNSVSVAVTPWEIAITGADTLHSGTSVTLTGTITKGPISPFQNWAWSWGLDPASMGSPPTPYTGGSGTSTLTFNAPVVNADTAVYVRVSLSLSSNEWLPAPYKLATSLILNYPSLDQQPIRLPLLAPTAGTLTVSFDRRHRNR